MEPFIIDVQQFMDQVEEEALKTLSNRKAAEQKTHVKSPYLTVPEAAAYLRSTVSTTYDRVKRGKLHPVPGSKGRLLFTRESLDKFANTRRR